MELCDATKIKELMARHGFTLSKSLGQNFLTDPAVPEKIAISAMLGPDVSVLEIGPGIGSLTRSLAARSGEVFALEIDRALSPVLDETLSDLNNVSVVFGDVLKTDLRAFASERFSFKKAVAVSNLPYYITAKTITALLEAGIFHAVTVMLQKETARKITAGPSDADRCLFGVIVNHYSIPVKLFSVPAGSFYPTPKVDSVVLRLDARPHDENAEQNELFLAVARAAFASRRKTIQNNLAQAFPELGKGGAERLLKELDIDPGRRGESLSTDEFYKITGRLMQKIQSI